MKTEEREQFLSIAVSVALVASVLGVAVGLYVGAWWRGAPEAPAGPSVSSESDLSSGEREATASPGRKGRTESAPPNLPGGTSSDASRRRLDTKKWIEDLARPGIWSTLRMRRHLSFVDALSPGEFEETILVVGRNPQGQQFLPFLYEGWATSDRPAALAHALTVSGDDRANALRAILGTWGAEDPKGALAWLGQQGDSRLAHTLGYSLVSHLARTDPRAALVALESPLYRGAHWAATPSFVYREYARTAPREAAALALELTHSGLRLNAVRDVAIAWSGLDADAAWAWSTSIPDATARSRAQAAMISSLSHTDPQAALLRLDDLPPSRVRHEAVQRIVQFLGHEDPPAALDLALAWGLDWQGSPVIGSIFTQWANTDPEAAFEVALNELEPGPIRDRALEATMTGAATHDVDTALEMLNTLGPGPTHLAAIQRIAPALAARDRDYALAWAEGLSDEGARDAAVREVVGQWARSDPAAAADYALGLENESQRATVLRRVASSWGHQDPTEAIDWVVDRTDASIQETVIPDLLKAWADVDLAQASEWALTLPEGKLREQSYQRLVSGWSSFDPSGAAEWLNRVEEGKARDQAVGSLADKLIRVDPDAALDWAGSVSDQGRRHALEARLARRWKQSSPDEARGWIRNSDLPHETKAELLK